MVEIDRRKASLIAEIEVSRGEMRSSARRIEASMDFTGRIRKNISDHLGTWLLGATAGGFLLSFVLKRTGKNSGSTADQHSAATDSPKTSNKWIGTSLVLPLAKLAFELVKPSIIEWVVTKSGISKEPTDS
jgi:hypothetical protein